MWWWWWGWVALIFIFLVLPWGYGWSRRDWGPPYPTYYRRRYRSRSGAVPPAEEPADVDPHEPSVPPMRTRTTTMTREAPLAEESAMRWAWLADLLWLAVLAAIAWAVYLWVT